MSERRSAAAMVLAFGVMALGAPALAGEETGSGGAQLKPGNAVKVQPRAKPGLPAKKVRGSAKVPASGAAGRLSNDAVQAQEGAQAAGQARRAEQMRRSQEAMRQRQRGDQTGDRAAGTALGGKGVNAGGATDANVPRVGTRAKDCVRNPQDCVAGAPHRGTLGTQPGSPAGEMTKGDDSAARQGLPHKQGDGRGRSTGSVNVDSRGNVHVVNTTTPDKNKSVSSSAMTIRPDGATRAHQTQTRADGSSTTTMVERDNKGNVVDKTVTHLNSEGVPVAKPDSQPNEGGSTAGRNDNCDWNPALGKCTKRRASVKEMTSQPVRGDTGVASASGSARPRLGAEAVTNPGDGSYSPARGARTGGGKPYDPRDPAGTLGGAAGGPNPPREKQ